jgi:hypothetical protein
MMIPGLDMTKAYQFGRMPSTSPQCLDKSSQFSCMPEMGFLISQLLVRQTCYLRKQAKVSHNDLASSLIFDVYLDLVTYCTREKIPFTVFEDWQYIMKTTKDVLEGKADVKKIAAQGLEEVEEDPSKTGRN